MTPEQEEFVNKVLAAVRELCAFTDAQAVAAFLAGEEIKGECGWPCTCPVARFVGKRINPDGSNLIVITVSNNSVMADDYGGGFKDGLPVLHAWIGVEQPVQDFIRGFDLEGRFPELIEAR